MFDAKGVSLSPKHVSNQRKDQELSPIADWPDTSARRPISGQMKQTCSGLPQEPRHSWFWPFAAVTGSASGNLAAASGWQLLI